MYSLILGLPLLLQMKTQHLLITDFMTSGGTDLTIPINTGEVKISVPIKGDDASEESETFTVTLSNASSAGVNEDVILVKATAKGTINDNDGPVIGFQSAEFSANEGATPAPTITFTVVANPTPTSDVTVKWATSVVTTDPADTADEGMDYTKGDGTLTFAANDTNPQTFTVALIDDNTPELDETFTVTLSEITGTGASLSDTASIAKG